MAYARIIDNVAVEIVGAETLAMFTDEIKAMFTAVADSVVEGSTLASGVWTAPPPPGPPPAPTPPVLVLRTVLSPVQFKLQFTAAERLRIRAAQAYSGTDPVKTQEAAAIDDFFDIVDDPRLTEVDLGLDSTIEGVNALVSFGLLTADRATAILAGAP